MSREEDALRTPLCPHRYVQAMFRVSYVCMFNMALQSRYVEAMLAPLSSSYVGAAKLKLCWRRPAVNQAMAL